jgi:hypothetical protein
MGCEVIVEPSSLVSLGYQCLFAWSVICDAISRRRICSAECSFAGFCDLVLESWSPFGYRSTKKSRDEVCECEMVVSTFIGDQHADFQLTIRIGERPRPLRG